VVGIWALRDEKLPAGSPHRSRTIFSKAAKNALTLRSFTPVRTLNLKYGSFLSLILLYVAGTMGIFSSYYTAYHRSVVRVEVKSAPEEGLVQLSFSEMEFNNIAWTEENTEFEWKGKMYDVSRIIHTPAGVLVLCENDSFEDLLVSLFNPDKQQDPGQSKKGSPQPQFFHHGWSPSNTVKINERATWTLMRPSLYTSRQVGISTPPPEADRLG